LGWAKDEKIRPEMNAGSAGYEKPSIFAYFAGGRLSGAHWVRGNKSFSADVEQELAIQHIKNGDGAS
jgi:hypothetical protein